MNSETIVMCVVALILGMLMANMLKNICGCNNITEGQTSAQLFTRTIGGHGHRSGMIDESNGGMLRRMPPSS